MAEFCRFCSAPLRRDSKLHVKLQFPVWGHEILIQSRATFHAPKIEYYRSNTYTYNEFFFRISDLKSAQTAGFSENGSLHGSHASDVLAEQLPILVFAMSKA
jgi:hypothetical protein